MFGWLSSWSREISRIAVEGTPSHSLCEGERERMKSGRESEERGDEEG